MVASRVLLILLFSSIWSIDLLINFINNGRPASVPIISLDDRIPFVAPFIYLYTIYFPIVVSPLFVLPVEKHLRRFVYSNITVMIVSYAVFLFFPTKVLRVPLHREKAAEFFTYLYHRVVAPYNLLPSLHISMLLLTFLSYYFWKRKIAMWLAIPIVLSCASVLFTKQHYILDVVTAVPLALAAFFVVRMLQENNAR